MPPIAGPRCGCTTVFALSTAGLAFVQAADVRRDRAAHDARRATLRTSVDAAAAEAMARTRSELAPLIERLDHAASGDDQRASIAALSRTLSDVLSGLERADEPATASDRASRAWLIASRALANPTIGRRARSSTTAHAARASSSSSTSATAPGSSMPSDGS